jgi:hypothetical protein
MIRVTINQIRINSPAGGSATYPVRISELSISGGILTTGVLSS